MKVLHVIHLVDPRTGGPGNVVRNIVRQQVRSGYEVALLATNIQPTQPRAPNHEFIQRMMADPDFAGAEVHIGKAFGRRRPWSNYAFSPACKRWLKRRLANRQTAPDLIHIHGVFSHLTSAAASLARRHSIPYLIEPFGCLDPVCFRMRSHLLKLVFTHLSLRKDLARAACVHAASPSEAEHVRRWVSAQRIRVLPHGVDLPKGGDSDAAVRQLVAAFPQVRDRRVILCVARAHPIKRINLLVEALAMLRAEFPELTLLVAGQDSGHMAFLQEMVRRLDLEQSVVFAGFLEGELKRGAFAIADLFALASMHENFGVAPVEAMAFAIPVLVTPEVASHVYVDQSGGGITVDGTAFAIAEGIRELLNADRKAMGQRGSRFVAENLSWPAVIEQLNGLYREILGRED